MDRIYFRQLLDQYSVITIIIPKQKNKETKKFFSEQLYIQTTI